MFAILYKNSGFITDRILDLNNDFMEYIQKKDKVNDNNIKLKVFNRGYFAHYFFLYRNF